MPRNRHEIPTCTSCGAPCRDARLCATCLAAVEADLGDVGALVQDTQRVFSSDGSRTKGSEDDPLVRSRPRRMLPRIRVRDGATFCVLDPATLGPVLVAEPLPPGTFGRHPSTRWDADHGLGREIEATVARQTATGKREGGRSSSKPLPFNDRVATIAHRVHNTLGTWVRDLHDGTEPWPVDDVVAFAVWLQARLHRIGQHPAAAGIERDVRGVVAALRRAVDRPADRWFMGPCDVDGCTEEHVLVNDDGSSRLVARATEMYATPGAETVRCPRCHTEYAITERRAWLLAAAEDQLAHAELIGRAAPALGIEITPSMIRNYADRNRIVAKSVDLQGRPLYRVGDVITVAQEVLERRALQAARRASEAEKRSKKPA